MRTFSRIALAALVAGLLTGPLPAQIKEGGNGPGSGNREQPTDRTESTAERRELQYDRGRQNFKLPDGPPSGPGPGEEAMNRLNKEMEKERPPEPEPEDKSGYFDDDVLTVEGIARPKEVDIFGTTKLPDGTRLTLTLYFGSQRLPVNAIVFTEGGEFRTTAQLPGLLAPGLYKVEAEFRKQVQPMEVRDQLVSFKKNRIVAEGRAPLGDGPTAAAEKLKMQFEFYRVLRILVGYRAEAQALAAAAEKKEKFYNGNVFDDGLWRGEIVALRTKVHEAYKDLDALGKSYLIKPLPQSWDLMKQRVGNLYDLTIAMTTEAYERAGSEFAPPEWPPSSHLYYFPRRKVENSAALLLSDAALHDAFLQAYGMDSPRAAEEQILLWVELTVNHDREALEELAKTAKEAELLEEQAWNRALAAWRQSVDGRPSTFRDVLSAARRTVLKDQQLYYDAELHRAPSVLSMVESLGPSTTVEVFRKKGVVPAGGMPDAPKVEEAWSKITAALAELRKRD